jgi:hypothetical protein
MEIRTQSSTWYQVLSFLSLAAALGLVSGVAFGAVALLLAGPAYGADSSEIKEGKWRRPVECAWPAPGQTEDADGSANARRTARRRTAALRAASLLELIELQDLDAGSVACPGVVVGLGPLVGPRLLLAADLVKGLPHVGIEARAVTERRVEDMFHAVSYAGVS